MRYLFIQTCLLMSFVSIGHAAPSRYSQGSDTATALQQVRDNIESIRHEVGNHESEIHMFDEKVRNLEVIIDSLRDQLQDSTKTQKNSMKENALQLETRLNSLEATIKGIIADIKQLKTHANETTTVLSADRQKITEMEKHIDSHSHNMESIQTALRSLMDILQVKSGLEPIDKIETSSEKAYRVKAGDSLEKIARANQTTIKALKELNNLSHDRIVIGQTLKLP